jgi:hypothetical protein
MSAAPDVLLDTWERFASAPPVTRSIELLAALDGVDRSQVAARPLGEHNRRLLAAGARLDRAAGRMTGDCPSCGAEVEVELPLADMASGPDGDPTLEAGGVAAALAGTPISLRPVTPADLEAALAQPDRASARRAVLDRCVTGSETERPPDDVLIDALAELDDGATLQLDVGCPSCDGRWEAEVDAGLLAWTALDRAARELLRQIEVLADRYGWTESEVLRLGPRRRSFYLEGALA